jgi:hypothetical protein
MSLGRSVVTHQRDNYACIAELVLHVLHVDCVGEFWNGSGRASVLVLRLYENDRSAICDLSSRNRFANVCHIVICGFEVVFGSCSQSAIDSLQPAREASTTDLCVDVWPRTCDEINPCFLGSIVKRF